MKYQHRNRERGVALVLVTILSLALLTLSVMSLDMTVAQSEARRGQEETFAARQIAESAVAHREASAGPVLDEALPFAREVRVK